MTTYYIASTASSNSSSIPSSLILLFILSADCSPCHACPRNISIRTKLSFYNSKCERYFSQIYEFYFHFMSIKFSIFFFSRLFNSFFISSWREQKHFFFFWFSYKFFMLAMSAFEDNIWITDTIFLNSQTNFFFWKGTSNQRQTIGFISPHFIVQKAVVSRLVTVLENKNKIWVP